MKKNILIVLSIISGVLLLICGLVAINLHGTSKELENNKKQTQQKQQNNKTGETVVVNQALASEAINNFLYVYKFTFDDFSNLENLSQEETNLLVTDYTKMRYVWYLTIVYGDETIDPDILLNVDINGKPTTGTMAITYEGFAKKYESYLGEKFTMAKDMMPNGFAYSEIDNRIYGSMPVATSLKGNIFKFNSLVKDGDKYYLYIDRLFFDIDDEEEYVKYLQYSAVNVVDYDEELVTSKIKLNLEKTTSGYVLKSMVAYK